MFVLNNLKNHIFKRDKSIFNYSMYKHHVKLNDQKIGYGYVYIRPLGSDKDYSIGIIFNCEFYSINYTRIRENNVSIYWTMYKYDYDKYNYEYELDINRVKDNIEIIISNNLNKKIKRRPQHFKRKFESWNNIYYDYKKPFRIAKWHIGNYREHYFDKL